MQHPFRNSTFAILTFLLSSLFPYVVHAQDGRYVTGATLELSVGDGTEVWLNGHKIAAADPTMNKAEGHTTVNLAAQLCFFQSQNVLAFKLTQSYSKQSLLVTDNDYLGINYVLTLTFSDNKQTTYSSNETAQHQWFQIKDKTEPEPKGWRQADFNDSQWQPAVGTKAVAEDAISDPKTHHPALSLGAIQSSGDGAITNSDPGTRSNFRRKFDLDIVPGPGCPQPPKPKPTATKVPPVIPTPIPPRPTATPRPRPTATFTFTFTNTPTNTPRPRPIPTATFTFTPIPRPPALKPIPTRRPRPVPPTPTNIPYFPPTNTPTHIRRPVVRPTHTPRPRPTPTFTPEPVASQPKPETIIFVNPPVNIYVQFEDGPGQYKLEILDERQAHIRTLLDHHIGGEEDQWLSWDGKNDEEQLMPLGQYYAIFEKDGKVLRRIALTWIH